MKNPKTILVLFLVFAAGVSVGIFGTRIAVRKVLQNAVADPGVVRVRLERELVRELGLNPRQQKAVREILIQSHTQIREFRRETQPRFTAILEKADARIAEELTPEQKARFEKFVAEKKKFIPRPLPPGERPGPGPGRR